MTRAQPDIRALLAAEAERSNIAKLARDTGLTRAGLYKALADGAQPRLDTLQRIAHAMGYRIVLAPVHASSSNR